MEVLKAGKHVLCEKPVGHDFGPIEFGHFRGMIVPSIELQIEIWDRLKRFLELHPV